MQDRPRGVVAVPDRMKLLLDFDAAAMITDIQALPGHFWVPHFRKAHYDGDWSGVALRSIGGDPSRIYPDPNGTLEFDDTEILASCPAIRRALSVLQCPLMSVRLLGLGPGAQIKEHHDECLGYSDGEVRLHVPIVSAPGVEFALAGRAVTMDIGECWYLDLRLAHRAANHSRVRRVHLVIDCKVNTWLEAVFNDSLQHQSVSPRSPGVGQLPASPTIGKAGGEESPGKATASPKATTRPSEPTSQ